MLGQGGFSIRLHSCRKKDQHPTTKRCSLSSMWGRGCGAVGRAVASDTRDPQIEPRHWQNFICLSIVINFEKTKINGEEAGNGPLNNNSTGYHPGLVLPSATDGALLFSLIGLKPATI